MDAAKIIAVYSLKGGVGKTTLAVNLAAEMAQVANGKVLLWDLDPQSATSFILGQDDGAKPQAEAMFEKQISPEKLIRPSALARLDFLPADRSLRGLDGLFAAVGKKRRLAKLIGSVAGTYDRIILDCPPGLSETSEQIFRAADVIIVPLIPSVLSRRALDEMVAYLNEKHKSHAPLLPVFSMVDRRRKAHKLALAAQPDWPIIPMASVIEKMAEQRAPILLYAERDPANQAFHGLAAAIGKKLSKL
jgi:cellulose biosynthesis protein BcsQ